MTANRSALSLLGYEGHEAQLTHADSSGIRTTPPKAHVSSGS